LKRGQKSNRKFSIFCQRSDLGRWCFSIS